MQKKTMLFFLIALAAIFLTAQSCGNFAMQQQSSDALDCEETGQLFCADDGKTRVCNFIDGAPHLEYDGQACDPETDKILSSMDRTDKDKIIVRNGGDRSADVKDACDLLDDGKYCEGNDRFTCENGDEDTSARITCSDGCVELVDKPGKASCKSSTTGNQQGQTGVAAVLNTFCKDQSTDGLYCPTSVANTLVYCDVSATSPAQVYWSCADASACGAARTAANPCLCDPSDSKCTPTPPPVACTDTDGGLVYDVLGTVVSGGVPSADSCKTGTAKLTEYYCTTAGNVGKQYYDCASIGKVCQDGACVSSIN